MAAEPAPLARTSEAPLAFYIFGHPVLCGRSRPPAAAAPPWLTAAAAQDVAVTRDP